MQERQIIINNLNINYKTAGTGLPFLILHGWGIGSDSWVEVADLLSQNDFQVIIPDLPGFGKSQPPQTPWDVDRYLDFLNQFVAQLRLNKFYLLGHSFGGALSAKFTYQNPSQVIKLILCDAAIIRTHKLGLRQNLAKYLSKTKAIAQKLPLGIYPVLKKITYRLAGTKDYSLVQGVMAQTFLNVIKQDTLDFARQIKTPALIIWGQNDKETPLEDARVINQAIANSTLKIISGTGHKPHRTNPRELSEFILEFIRKS